LIDGFPRNVENHEIWGKLVDSEKCNVKFLLWLELSEDIMIERIKERA